MGLLKLALSCKKFETLQVFPARTPPVWLTDLRGDRKPWARQELRASGKASSRHPGLGALLSGVKRRVCLEGRDLELRAGSRQGGEHSSSGSNLAVRRGEPLTLHHSAPRLWKAQTLGPLERRLTFSLTKLCWPPLTLCPRSQLSSAPPARLSVPLCVCGPVCVLRLFPSHPRSLLPCESLPLRVPSAMTVSVFMCFPLALFSFCFLYFTCLSAPPLPLSLLVSSLCLPVFLSSSVLCLWPTLYPSTHTHMHTSLPASLCLGSPAQPRL